MVGDHLCRKLDGEPMTQVNPSQQFGTAKLLVAPSLAEGTHLTIQSALADAVSGDTIFIRNGAYSGTVTAKTGVNLVAYDSSSNALGATLTGSISFNDVDQISVSGLRIVNAGGPALSFSGAAAQRITIHNCDLQVADNGAISDITTNAGNLIEFVDCRTTLTNANSFWFSISSPGTYVFRSCECKSALQPTLRSIASDCNISLFDCVTRSPLTLTGAAAYFISNLTFLAPTFTVRCIETTGTATGRLVSSFLLCNAVTSCIDINVGSTMSITESSIGSEASAVAISGTGTLNYTLISYLGISNSLSVTTRAGGSVDTFSLKVNNGASLSRLETGTFLPTIAGATTPGTATYTVQEGRFMAIGNLFFFGVVLTWTGHTGTGQLRFANFPITAAVGSNARIWVTQYTGGSPSPNSTGIYCTSVSGQNYFPAFEIDINTGAVAPIDINIAATAAFEGFISIT